MEFGGVFSLLFVQYSDKAAHTKYIIAYEKCINILH